MPHQDTILTRSENGQGNYFRLIAKLTWGQRLARFCLNVIKTPVNIYQWTMGRLFTHVIINPLLRKEERQETLLLQNHRHPDPLFASQDEMVVINVSSKKNILLRTFLNWHKFFESKTIWGGVVSLFSQLISLFPKITSNVEHYIDRIVDDVENQIIGDKQDAPLQASQILFRGLENLKPQQREIFYAKLTERFGYDFRQNKKYIDFYTLQTEDNALLDSVEVHAKSALEKSMAERRFIISCMPRSNNYIDWLKQYRCLAKELDVSIIAFNYRGTGLLSKGIIYNENSLHEDTYAQVQRLLKMGAKPENIALMGECLGANVATYTAGTLHQQGLPVKLYNARSFRSLTSLIEGHILPTADDSNLHPKTWLKWIGYGIFKLVFHPLLLSTGWTLNVEKQFLAIPPKDRDFLVVRSKKDAEGKRFADDLMVPHNHASIYSLVKEQRKLILEKLNNGEEISDDDIEWLCDTPANHKFHVSSLLHEGAARANGHTSQAQLLVPTYPGRSVVPDGREYAIGFFRRVWPHQPTCHPAETQMVEESNYQSQLVY
ncbi:alpha/beta hydrolase [Legionella maioricensis]|uniref:Alpha/beta hydrolase n=1 Tax=Legionella maioricensis TaxID=2896528 RepID=A0A9X2CZT2_9GAMM|nr:alpha/beta hydrolase [Legionella maioricensis]MCL9683874.1 alpha/beta hydrolase [Legionella maioricensis]MCL9686721.1 alpha/beta hydrolase [Legionella maioricensis]